MRVAGVTSSSIRDSGGQRSYETNESSPGDGERPWHRLPPSVAEELTPLVQGITDEVLLAIHAEMPATKRAGPSFDAALRTGIEAAYHQFLHEIGHPETNPDRSIFRDGGRGQMRAGRGFDELLAFYRISALVLWRRISAAAQRGEVSVETIALLGESTIAYIHELSRVAARGYMEAQAVAARGQHARRETLVRLLLLPDPDERTVAEAAQAAACKLPERLAAIVLTRDVEETALAEFAPDVLAAHVGSGTCVLASDVDLETLRVRLATVAQPSPVAAVGPLVSPLQCAVSYKRAVMTLALTNDGVIPADRVVDAADHTIALVLAGDHHLAREFSQQRLAPLSRLPADTRLRMTETLQAWLAHPARPQAIAEHLCLHVQSVRYRLSRLRDLLGDQLDDPEARFELALALRAQPEGQFGAQS